LEGIGTNFVQSFAGQCRDVCGGGDDVESY